MIYWKELFLAHRLIYTLHIKDQGFLDMQIMFTLFFYKKERLPSELSNANKSTPVAIAGCLVRRYSKSGFFDSIFISDGEQICHDKTTQKRQWLDPGKTPKPTPKPDIHRNKEMS